MLMYEDLTVIAVLCRHSYPHLSLKCDTGMPFDTWIIFEFSPKEIK